MTFQQKLQNRADSLTRISERYTYKVNRRNGYYALDYYNTETGQYISYITCLSGHEMNIFLDGMLEALGRF